MQESMRAAGVRLPIVIGAMAAVVCASWILADENAQRPPDHRPNRGVRRGDWPQLGGSSHRNNAPQGPRIPIDWDVATGRNIKWSAPLGSQTYGNVVVANGQIYVGTNNAGGRLSRYPAKVDLGVLLCLRESDGSLLWQYSSEKLPSGRVHDWEMLGLCSSPVVEGERLWFVSNRAEVVCLDTKGFYDDDDDGPVTGVWSKLFEVVADLGQWAKPSDSGEFPPMGRSTLQFVIDGLNTEGAIPSNYFLKPTGQPLQWAALIGENPTPLFHVALTREEISITGLNGGDKEVRINSNLTAGLDERRLSAGLQALFRSKGVELPEDALISATQPGASWTLTAKVAGQPASFRLKRDKGMFICERQIDVASPDEADIVWTFDMMKELGVRQHNAATCAPTIWQDVLFICTSNGVDEAHRFIPAPDAPSFIALDKRSGKVLWTDNSPGCNIMHGQWSCPAVGVFDTVPQVIFAGGDGWLYSFRADRWEGGRPIPLWKFDANPKDSVYKLERATRNPIIAVPVIHEGLVYVAVGEDPEHGEGNGHVWCVDPTKRGDVSAELVVDDEGSVLPHQRIQASASPVELFYIDDASESDELDQGIVPRSIRAQFRKVGLSLPPFDKVETTVKGQQWNLRVMLNGREQEAILSAPVRSLHQQQRRITARLNVKTFVIPNPKSAVVWHYTGHDKNGNGKVDFEETMHRTIGGPAIKNGLLFIADASGLAHCLDARTGKQHWTCDLLASTWATPLIVGDHVYAADQDGDIAIFSLSADRKKSVQVVKQPNAADFEQPIHEINMTIPVYTTPVAAHGVLYIATFNRLFAISHEGK